MSAPGSVAWRTGPTGSVTDGVVLFLAAWTLSCHGVVLAGGTLFSLLVVFPFALCILLSVWWRLPWPCGNEKRTSQGTDEPLGRLPVALALGCVGLLVLVRHEIMVLWWSIAAILVVGGCYVLTADRVELERPSGGPRAEKALWLIALLSVCFALVCHRPDADDAFYVNVAVAAADLPSQALYADDTIHGIVGVGPYISIYRLHSYELLNGALSFVTGIPVQVCFYFISTSLFALLIPLAWARLFRILVPRHWLIAVLSLVLLLALIGEQHRWYGNFSFVRIWQGKSIMLSVVLPLILTHAISLGTRPSIRRAVLLGCSVVAAVGCSSSGLWLAPTLAVLGLASALRRSSWKSFVLATSVTAAYTLMIGLEFFRDLQYVAERTGSSNAHGERLAQALAKVLGDGELAVVALIAVALSWLVAPPGLGRRFAVAVPAIVWLTLLNPYASDLVSSSVTGPSFWRALWALPVPALLALVMVSPFRLGLPSPYVLWLLLLVVTLGLTDRLGPSSLNAGLRLERPGFKVAAEDYAAAEEIVRVAVPASHVVAPAGVAILIPTLHDRPYPLAVRGYLRLKNREERQQREMLTKIARRYRPRRRDDLIAAREAIDRFAITAFCFRLRQEQRDHLLRQILLRSGFELESRVGPYEIWSRRAPSAVEGRNGGGYARGDLR